MSQQPFDRLVELSMVPPLAKEVYRLIVERPSNGGSFNEVSGNYVFSTENRGGMVSVSGSSDVTITVPQGLPLGFYVDVMLTDMASVTFAPDPGVSIESSAGNTFSDANTVIFLRPVSVNKYLLTVCE